MLHNRHDDFTAAPWYETYWYGGCAWCHQSHICIHNCRGTWRAAVQDARDSRRCFHVTASRSKQRQRLRRHHRCGGPLLCSQSSAHTHVHSMHFKRRLQGGHKVGEKIPRVFQSHNYIFPEVTATNIYAIMTFIYPWSFHINYYSCD